VVGGVVGRHGEKDPTTVVAAPPVVEPSSSASASASVSAKPRPKPAYPKPKPKASASASSKVAPSASKSFGAAGLASTY
jgi:hypothetical protein